MAQAVKGPPTTQETQVWSLGWEDALEKGMATHSSILAGKIPWTEELGGLQSMRSQRVGYDWASKHARGCFHSFPGSPRSLISTCRKLLPGSCVLIAYDLNQLFYELLSSSSIQRALCLSGKALLLPFSSLPDLPPLGSPLGLPQRECLTEPALCCHCSWYSPSIY